MLTLQFGQCGNQLGHELFTKITKDIQCQSPGISFLDSYEYIESCSTKWFDGKMKNGKHSARAILIDTEQKVIDKVINTNDKEWCFKPENIITSGSTSGSANNWSFGYLKKGPNFANPVLEVVRRELEKVDRLDTFLCLLSCAGGTGSGIGSYTIEILRDAFPSKNIISHLVFPFGFGEVATQNYNTVLSLAKIVENTDIIIVLENDRLHKELLQSITSSTSKSANEINFPNDINDIACQRLLSIFQPAINITNNYTNHINYIISKIVPHPAYKLTTIEAVPLLLDSKNSSKSLWQLQKNTEKWYSHFKSLKRSVNHTNNYHNIHSLSNILITRGSSESKKKHNHHTINNNSNDDPKLHHDQLNHNDIYTKIKWLPLSERFTHFHQQRRLLNLEKFSSIISNNSQISQSLDDIINKAWNSYTYGAFLHQYKSHGLEDDDFLRAFAKVEHLNNNYKNL